MKLIVNKSGTKVLSFKLGTDFIDTSITVVSKGDNYLEVSNPALFNRLVKPNQTISVVSTGVKPSFQFKAKYLDGSYLYVYENIPSSLTLPATFHLPANIVMNNNNTFYFDRAYGDIQAKFISGQPLEIVGSTGANGCFTILNPEFVVVDAPVIVGVVDGAGGSFEVAGDLTELLPSGATFNVTGSTGNNGAYVVTNVNFTGTNTLIFVDNIPDATVDGNVEYGYTRVQVSEDVTDNSSDGVVGIVLDSGGPTGVLIKNAPSVTGVVYPKGSWNISKRQGTMPSDAGTQYIVISSLLLGAEFITRLEDILLPTGLTEANVIATLHAELNT